MTTDDTRPLSAEDSDALRRWWDGLREIEQFTAYLNEKANADALAAQRPIGVEEAIAQGQRMLAASEAAADREITRLREECARLALGAAFDRDALDAERARHAALVAAARDVSRVGDVLFSEDQLLATVPAYKMLALRAALDGEEKP